MTDNSKDSKPLSPKGDMISADLLFDIILRCNIKPQKVQRVKTFNTPDRRPTHNIETDDPFFRRESIWKLEGEDPKFDKAQKDFELQIWDDSSLKRFHGRDAALRLKFITPTFFSPRSYRRFGAVGVFLIDRDSIRFCATHKSLQRSIYGLTGKSCNLLNPRFNVKTDKNSPLKNQRFYQSITYIYIFFKLWSRYRKDNSFLSLSISLIKNMIDEGVNQSTYVRRYLSSLNCILHGKHQNHLEEWILQFNELDRTILWKSRKLFYKDDSEPGVNIKAAIQRMCGNQNFSPIQLEIAQSSLSIFQAIAGQWTLNNLERLKEIHDNYPLHRSSASLFFTRKEGGGAGEMALMVGLYRLSQGKRSPLTDIWGSVPNEVDLDTLWQWLTEHHEQREEIFQACSWFIDEIEARKIAFPFACIYPDREAKGRVFMLLPYCLQLPGSQAAAVMSDFFRQFTDTSEVFNGFRDLDLMNRIKEDLNLSSTNCILSLDSAVATDTLPHEYCKAIYEPFYPAFSPLTIKGLENIFKPTLVFESKKRPRPILPSLEFTGKLFDNFDRVEVIYKELSIHYKMPRHQTLSSFPDDVPNSIRMYEDRFKIIEYLTKYNRIIVKSPTGTGKTVLAATLFNSLIQFPSIASLEIFSETLKYFKVHHHCYHFGSKMKVREDPDFGQFTILCTAYYIESLSDEFPGHVIVLDEAETKQERFLWNLLYSKISGRRTIIMSATPEEIRNEESTFKYEVKGATNFPIEEKEILEQDLISQIITTKGKVLLCTFSEPHCKKLELQLKSCNKSILCLTTSRRERDYQDDIKNADIIISTNAIRSSVTIPGLVEVFDFGKVYENVYFPLIDMTSLVLFDVSTSMRIQLKGRVGRTQPGIYWRVTSKRVSEPYTEKYLDRLPYIASLISSIPIKEYARELNESGLLFERFIQVMTWKVFGVRFKPYEPLWIGVVNNVLSPRHPVESVKYGEAIIYFIGYQAFNIHARLSQIKENEETIEFWEDFNQTKSEFYPKSVIRLIYDLIKGKSGLKNEIAQLNKYVEQFCARHPNKVVLSAAHLPDEWIWDQHVQQCIFSSLWSRACIYEDNILKGIFRDFNLMPPKNLIDDEYSSYIKGECYIPLDISIFNGRLSCQAALRSTVFLQEYYEALTTSFYLDEKEIIYHDLKEPDILTYEVRKIHDRRQSSSMHLSYNSYSPSTLYNPSDYERIWDCMTKLLYSNKVGDLFFTKRGSPMSSTASFSVLNALGLIANIQARNHTQEPLHSASVFGDDALVVGSKEAALKVIEIRESFGLTTKHEATGLIDLYSTDSHKALAVFTERLLTPDGERCINPFRPAGLVRLYQAYHHDCVLIEEPTYLPDMTSYEVSLQNAYPELLSILREEPHDMRNLFAYRQTAPRALVTKALSSNIGPRDYLAEGKDLTRLFEHLEAIVLLKYPSTKGRPDRILSIPEKIRKYPLASYSKVVEYASKLQGNGCYFKLRGPPLRFKQGPNALSVAKKESLLFYNEDLSRASETKIFRTVGWGDISKCDTLPFLQKQLQSDISKEKALREKDLIIDPITSYNLPF